MDFDHHDPDFIEGRLRIYDELRGRCPVALSDTYGGFWVLTGYEEVFSAARDEEHFSSAHGLLIPDDASVRLLPLQADLPELERYRALLSPFMTPRAMQALEPEILHDISARIDGFEGRGSAEVVHELAMPVPARATMRLIGLDPDDWKVFGDPLHRAAFATPGSPEYAQAHRDIAAFDAVIEREVSVRRAEPRDDLISKLLGSKHDGIRTSHDEVLAMIRMLIFGGMDTVSAATGNVIAILAVREDLRSALAREPTTIPRAVEEFLRYEAPIQAFARRVEQDTVVGGQRLARGERVWLTWGSANHDPVAFEAPGKLKLDRRPNRHLAFGVGAHRCLGSTMARIILTNLIEMLLARIPDFRLAPDGVQQPATIGQILGKRAVHIEF